MNNPMNPLIYSRPRFRLNGDRALLVDCGDGMDMDVNQRVLALAARLGENRPVGINSVIPAYRSLTVIYDPLLTDQELLQKQIDDLVAYLEDVAGYETALIAIPVLYGGTFGPDIEFVSAHTRLTVNEIIDVHSSGTYPIYMLGFTPGFCYLGGMDHRLQTPRRETPRISIPAGSVGIAGLQTGMYPVSSPGGWQIIGRTPLRLFAPERENPFLYKPGDKIRFYPVTQQEFQVIMERERT